MASKVPDEGSNTKTDEENPALRIKMKRARRVSFADTEITSVHIFRRDDDSETPPPSKHTAAFEPANEVIGFFRDLGGDSEDSGDDEGSSDGRKSFLRPIGSPSPGSSTAGSVTSNDEDNFFGPVSASFIRPGRLSDSAASDEHHEETLDTTAFSMHYRSLARSDAGEAKTPTAVQLVFDEKTSTKDSNPNDSGSSMALTEFKKLSSQSLLPYEKVGSGDDSDDMSIVDANPNKYDYGRLSPTLDALLAESSKDMIADSVSVPVNSKSPMGSEVLRSDQNGTVYMDGRNGRDLEFGNLDALGNSAEASSISHTNLGEANGSLARKSFNYPSTQNNVITASVSNHQMQSPNQLLSVRQQEAFLNTPNPTINLDIVSPFLKQADFQSHDYMKHDQSILSIQKSNSRSRISHISYSGSSIKQGIDNLKRKLSKYSSISYPGGSVLYEDGKELQSEYVGAPIAPLEEQFFTADWKNEDVNLVSININEVVTPRSTSKLGQNKEIVGLVKDGDSLSSMSMGILSKDKPSKLSTPLSSSFQLASSARKVMLRALTSEDSANKMFTSGTDSASQYDHETNLPHMQIKSGTLQDLQSPRDKITLNFHLESSEKNCQIGPTIYGSGTTEPIPLKSPSTKELTHSTSKEVQIQSPSREMRNQEAAQQELTESPSRKNPSESSPRKLLTKSPLRKEPTLRSPKKVPAQSSPRVESTLLFPRRESSQSPYMKKLIWSPLGNKAIQSPVRKEPTENPSRLDISDATNGGDMLSILGKDMASPQPDSSMRGNDNHHEGLHISQSPLSQKDAEISFERKRRSVEVVLEDGKYTYKNPRIQSPEVYQIGNSDLELFSNDANKVVTETVRTVGDKTHKHWLDILVKFTSDADQLLPPPINKLNFKAISTMEDVLLHFLKVKKYEMFGSEIQSQKVADHSSVRHNKRIAETKLLLYKLVYEKAKLRLMCTKHEKLLKKVQLLNSRIEECQMLKSSYIQQSKFGRRDTQLDDTHLQSCSDNLKSEHQFVSAAMETMKQEIKTLDGKINSLSNLLHGYSKVVGEPSCANSLISIQDHLKRRECCRLICQDLQLWKVDGLESQKGHYNVLLNYQGYLSQRFTLNLGLLSSISISNQLNDANIAKIFPNMDAHAAFAFVLNAGAIKRDVDSKFLVQETQVTHSLLCNLIDVIEEVQMAQIEIANLIQTNFFSPSAQQLSLQLCFVNFGTGIRVTLMLDVTCLNSGVYPSEILPYQVYNPQANPQKFKSLEDEIRSAAENLEVGYMRIMRLCKCVSRVLQVSIT